MTDYWKKAASYAYCQQLARREAANFYHAFWLLPRPQRLAMCALYSFLRISDDIADACGETAEKRSRLDEWQRQLDQTLAGHYNHPIHAALDDTVKRYQIPPEYLEAALDGVRMDLDIQHYNTFEDLYLYCYRVASAVGLSCVHIWGFREARALEFAEAAGIALQLTNILRDLAEDADRGRVYLPREDLERFGYGEMQLRRQEQGEQFQALMRFQVERASSYYDRAQDLAPFLPRPGRSVFLVMLRTYRGLLDAIASRHYDVFSGRVRLSRWYKIWLVLQVLPIRWGWV